MAKPKTPAEVKAIRDLISNLGLMCKLIVEFIPTLEGLMKTESDLKGSLDKLRDALTALTAAVQLKADRTNDVASVDGLTEQAKAITATLTETPQLPVI